MSETHDDKATERAWTDADRAEYWRESCEHYAGKMFDVQRALEGWRRDPEAAIRRIGEIVGYYIAEAR